MGIFFAVFGMLIYLIETGLQLHVCWRLWEVSSVLAGLSLSYVLGSLVIVNIVSAVMVLRTMDFSGKTCGRCLCVLLHSCQLGLIWRCLKLLILYDESDWKEYLGLRLIHTALQSLPFVVTSGYYMFTSNLFDSESVFSLFLFLVSSAIALATFNLGKYLFDSEEFLEWKARARKPVGICLLVFGTFLMLISRCGSFILFMSVFHYWILVPIGGHFLVYILITSIYSGYTNGCGVWSQIKNGLTSYLNIFDLVERESSKVSCRNVFYYSAVVIENVTMTAVWMVAFDGDYLFKLCIVSLIIVSFIFGVILKSSSCGCIHWVDSDDPISVDTMDLALYITKQAITSPQTNNHNADHRSHDQSYLENGSHFPESIQIEDGHLTGYDNEGFHSISSPNLDTSLKHSNKKSSKKKKSADDSLTQSDKSPRKIGLTGSSGDVASSNSRNTNTLNISSQSNRQSKKGTLPPDYPDNSLASPGGTVLPRSSTKHRKSTNGVQHIPTQGTLSDRGAPKQRDNLLVKQFSLRKTKDIPLFPNECNGIEGSKAFGSPKAKHVLSNSVEEYDPDDSESSDDSEYISYSYYYDTDWSTMLSFDSEDANTWAQPVSLVNLHSLPKDKSSATQSVQTWLSQLEEWEPIIEPPEVAVDEMPDVLDKTSRQLQDQYVSSSHHSDTSHRSSSVYDSTYRRTPVVTGKVQSPHPNRSYRGKTHHNNVSSIPATSFISHNLNKPDRIGPSSSGASRPPIPALPMTGRGTMVDNGVLLWQHEDTASPDCVQESMV
ncbi:uncharacterized protein LOC110441791 [Mizuhopecten yessoensis]|uniref:XK-related protein n=1 Tax=Mizuhopecten yessoensis TaxID=6573 RepID=A0A210PIP3_MIZYE|nr:uncharacterized protein LOC110441791 [Mizuhopecten yessoensis]OWF36344.1 XK-related protein 4 [Mizuhopecten yessoensis]